MTVEIFTPQLTRNGAPVCYLCGGMRMNGLNCSTACEVMFLYRASQGRITTTACHVRDLTNDCSGGTNLIQMQAVSVHYGIRDGRVYQPIDFDQVASWVNTGRYGAILQISYSIFVGTPYDRLAGAFRGNHAVYLSRKGGSTGTLRVGDPLAAGYADIPTGLLKRAAQALDLGGPVGENRLAAGKCYAYLTPIDPITAAPTHTATVTTATSLWNDGTKQWVYNGPNAIKVGTVLTVRGAGYVKGGVTCYPVNGPGLWAGYYVPATRVRLS